MNLRQLRKNKGMSRTELAYKAGVSEKTIYRAETGQPVRRETLARICKILEIGIEEVEGLKILD